MPEPTTKAPQITNLLDAMFNRTEVIKTDKCVFCEDPNMEFTDELSKKEYKLSGMCQNCQDDFFTA